MMFMDFDGQATRGLHAFGAVGQGEMLLAYYPSAWESLQTHFLKDLLLD